jgi:hypothetical protein
METQLPTEERCQLRMIYGEREGFSRPARWIDRLYLLSLRIGDALSRRIEKILRAASEIPTSPRDPGWFTEKPRKGDLVEVRSVAEIEKTLTDGKTRGLQFMTGMARYAGTRAVVFRRVNLIFDEQIRAFRKCDSVILDGVICDGHDMFNHTGCDRCCYFFWKDEWLRKLS